MRLTALLLLPGALAGVEISGSAAATAGGYHIEYRFEGGSDAANPQADLMSYQGVLYGTSPFGGSNRAGSVYSLDLKTGREIVVYYFKGGSDGGSPYATLIKYGRILYGTTKMGGTSNLGTVFSIDPQSLQETVI